MTTNYNPKVSIGIGRRMIYRPNEIIFSEGQQGKEMYVVESGRVKIFLTTQTCELTLSIMKKGDFFGEMALLEDLPRSASAAAVENSHLIAIGKTDFKYLIKEHPEIAMKVLGRFCGRLRDADNLINLLLLGDVTGYIINHLVELALKQHGSQENIPKECFLSISLKDISASTNIDYSKVKHVMQELEKIGLASELEKGIIIRKHKKLKTYLEYFNWRERSRLSPENTSTD